MQFSQDDIRKALGETTFMRGLDYARQQRVLAMDEREDGVIESTVKGSGRHVYDQEIEISTTGNRLKVTGDCTCPVGYNCKHVAAVLVMYALLHQKQPIGSSAAAAAGGKRIGPAPQPALSPAFTTWLRRIEAVLEEAQSGSRAGTADVPATKGPVFRLAFVLTPVPGGRRVSLSLCKARLRANGDIAAAAPVRDLNGMLFNPPAFVTPEDDELIQCYSALYRSGYYYEPHTEPAGKIGAQLLRMLLQDKKLFWANSLKDAGKGMLHRLHEAPAREAELAWREQHDQWRLAWQFLRRGDETAEQDARGNGVHGATIDYVLPTDPPWYVDNLSCGELALPKGVAGVAAQTLLAAVAQTPPLGRQESAAVARELLLRGLSQLVPLPCAVKETVRKRVRVETILRLGSTFAQQDYAELVFSYDGREVAIDGQSAQESIVLPGTSGIDIIPRDRAAEDAALRRLQDAGFRHFPDAMPAGVRAGWTLPSPGAWLEFVRVTLPQLAQDGWRIEKLESFRYDLAEVDDWYAEIDEAGGNPWFDLELGIVVNRERISLLPVLIKLIRQAPADFNPQALAQHADDDQLLVDLPNGARVALPWERIKPILATLGELYFAERAASRLRLPTLDAARLAQLAGATELRWLGGERLCGIGEKLNAFGGVRAVAPPQGLQATLRDYQRDGLAWMQFLREYDLAGILADDMGLGKTVQTLAHILLEKEAGRLTAPALVVAPTSLMGNWQAEAARFAPQLRVLTLQGRERLAQFDRIGQYDLVLTTYALLPRDQDKLRRQDYHLMILDEAHYIKNARSKATQAAALLLARHRLCLTGTPLENHLGELWSQFHFLLPGLLGEEKQFNTQFRHPIEKQGDEMRRALLSRRIKPFLLRRTKDKVAGELPPKTEMVRMVELAGAQRDLYETVRLAMDEKVRHAIAMKGVARSQIVILEALLKLRQVCCDPRLVKLRVAGKAAAPSAKLAELLEMLEALLAEGRRILVFSQFTSMLALIEDELRDRRIPYALLTGDTEDRDGAVRAFQEGDVPLFLISLKAGGVGLNLTAADTVIHYDPWWNPAAENQATDRAWRIGQDKPVFVYKLIARGTLEEKIQALQQKKAALAQAMLGMGEGHKLNITPEDLQAIFAPLAG